MWPTVDRGGDVVDGEHDAEEAKSCPCALPGSALTTVGVWHLIRT